MNYQPSPFKKCFNCIKISKNNFCCNMCEIEFNKKEIEVMKIEGRYKNDYT